MYGVKRGDIPSGSERLGDICVRRLVMHANMEYSEIIMSGACSFEGKTYRAIASSKPSKYTRQIVGRAAFAIRLSVHLLSVFCLFVSASVSVASRPLGQVGPWPDL